MRLAKLPPPVVPGTFYAAGLNYRAHIEWANRAHGAAYTVPTQADIGYRSNNALTWQPSDRTLWRAKNSDTFKPMGPRIVSGIDPMNQVIEVRVNGRSVSRYNTRDMIFSVAHFISRMSRYVTLHPNDVIWLGCDGPTEPALQPGDLVEVVNDAIGVLANRVRREE